MKQYAGIYWIQQSSSLATLEEDCCSDTDLYQRLQLQFYALLMMGAMDTRNM
jgi:hypothetical protein